MKHHEISVSGAVVYWSVGATKHQELIDRLKALGLGEFSPAEQTDHAALREVLKAYFHRPPEKLAVYKNRTHIVQARLKQDDGFDLVEVEEGTDGNPNRYTVKFGAAIIEGKVTVTNVSGIMDDVGYEWRLQELFDKAKSICRASAVGSSLVRILKHLGGTALRPSGAVYWIPESAVETWAQVAAAVEESAEEPGRSCVFRLTTKMDDECVRAVKHAIIEEVTGTAADIGEKVFSGELGERAMETQKHRAKELHDRIGFYESVLGEALERLHESVASVEAAMVTSTIKAM